MIGEEVFYEVLQERQKKVYMLTSSQIDFYWGPIVELLGEVPGFYDYYSSEWAHGQIKMGHLQVWALEDDVIRGIVLTRILVFPKQKTFEVMAIAGADSLHYLDLLDGVFERIARSEGCATISGLLRPGLSRKMKKHGAEVRAVVVSRPVGLQKDQ